MNKIFPWPFRALLLCGVFLSAAITAPAQDAEGEALEARTVAMEYVAEGSWAKAQPVFEEIAASEPSGTVAQREAAFYADYAELAVDLAQAGFGSWQTLSTEPWVRRLEALEKAAAALRGLDQERWLTASEHLGALQTRYRWEGRSPTLGAYETIFAYWAESTDLEEGRREYLRLVGELAERRELDHERRTQLMPYVENAAGLAQTPAEKQRFQWLWASFLVRYGDEPSQQLRRGTALQQAIMAGREAPTHYYASALLDYGEWASRYGVSFYGESGELQFRPDYALAAQTYRTLLALDEAVTSPAQLRHAENRLEWVERTELEVLVPYNFRPETEIHFFLRWRNLDPPRIRVYPVEAPLVAEGFFNDFEDLDLSARGFLEEQQADAAPEARHYPVKSRIRLQADLPRGAYLIEAESGGVTQRALLMVSDLAIVTHAVDEDLVAFVCDPTTGHAVEAASIHSIVREQDSERARELETAVTDANGLSRLAERPQRGAEQLLVAAHPERGVVLARESLMTGRGEEKAELTVYSMAERELFRPGETVRGHFWARWATPEGWAQVEPESDIVYRVIGPRGTTVAEGTVALSSLGSGSFNFKLPAEPTLGSYSVRFAVAGEGETPITTTTTGFFRVEAFRTPEIQVSIEVDPAPGGARLLGDTLEGTVEVAYYAGGQVEDAAVELIVQRQQFIPWPWQEYEERPAGGARIRPAERFEEVQRLMLQTDARGVATFQVPTAEDGEVDWVYLLEARVRDLSRREVTARHRVTLSRQGYYAQLQLEHRLVAPGDRAELEVVLQTADREPVADRGTLRVTRERWREIYIHRRRGDEIGAEEYRDLPERSLLVSAQSDYYLKERGFVTEEVTTEEVSTDESGRAHFAFEPADAGYYHLNWVSRGSRGQPVVAETALWVSDDATTEIGYRPGGVELIADAGPHVPGDVISLLVTVPTPDRSVLVSIHGDGVEKSIVVPVEGTSRLIAIEVEEAHRPNAFINASMVADGAVFHDVFELLVPPRKQFLEVTVTPDADGYEPRDSARFKIAVRDAEGAPVSTEVAVSVADEALFAIAPRQRPEVRNVFYGDRRYNRLEVGGSLQWRGFFQPLETETEEESLPTQPGLESEVFDLSLFDPSGSMNEGLHLAMMADTAEQEAARSALAQSVKEAGQLPPLAAPEFTRRDFRSTAFWNPRVETDANGEAVVDFTFPDDLTEWRADVVAITADTRVGEGGAATTTRLPLIARLQAPRFLTERDEAVLTGTFQNNSEHAETVQATLVAGSALELETSMTQTIEVPPNTTRRLTWKARAVDVGAANVELTARSERAGDAVVRPLPVVPHGVEILRGLSGRFEGEALHLRFDIPTENPGAEVRLRAAPTLATQFFSALPFLIEYPYGCIEQTLSRFLPALAVRRSMRDLGYPADAIDAEIFRGLSVEARGEREDLRAVLEPVVEQSIARLEETQKADGSWPWMPQGPTDAYMTAYAVYALTLAEEFGVPLGEIRLDAARNWLERTLTEAEMTAAHRAWMLHALASRHRAAGLGRPSRLEARAFLRLMEQRDEIGPMHLALMALTAKYFGFEEDAAMLLDNLANSARESNSVQDGVRDAEGEPVTLPEVHWGQTSEYFAWAEGAVETTAMVLEALLAVRPDHRWVEPAVAWLARNRTGTYWHNTRATALTALALTSYLHAHEPSPDAGTWALSVNGSPVDLSTQDAQQFGSWRAPLDITLPAELLQVGENHIRLRRSGTSPFYFTLHTRHRSTAEPLPAASSNLRITRSVEHLAPVPTLLSGMREEMRPLHSGSASIGTGERVEVTLRVESTRDLRYVLLEDVKPAGFEAVQLLSGALVSLERVPGTSANGKTTPAVATAYQELLDRKVGFLIDYLPAGTWELRYRLRAETPGDYHALPAKVEAMYLPSVRGNSHEFRIKVSGEDEE